MNIFKALEKEKKKSEPIVLYPEKIFSKNEGEMQAFSDLYKLKNVLISIH